ncbi:MAG: cytochrome c biogenesis protein CcsA [Spirochaetia bacterium]|nr:cytochrome c biogenesis protein CcsA [Spirochaetia bacterium]
MEFFGALLVDIGAISIHISLGTAVLSIVTAIQGLKKRDESYLIISRQLLYLHFIFITTAVISLIVLLMKADFSVIYVVDHVSKSLPTFYRFSALWAGAEGSILFWAFLLMLFAFIAIKQVENREPVLVPYMILIFMMMALFFSILLSFSKDSDPFKVFMSGDQRMMSDEGKGLNPLLQHWAMVIHPPILFFGYVSFAVPFAIAMASLLAGKVNLEWTRLVRRWTLFSWFSLGLGIMLGGKWAYEELGWGGYWAWDPVENASLMPWLTGTAFLHSILVQEKRGMLKMWNMILVSLSFTLCIFGTFLTKSGIVNSVHAFTNTDIGPFFEVYLLFIIVSSISLIVYRADLLKSERSINSFLSREAGFLFNNVLLLSMAGFVFFGTLWPVFSEIVYGEKVTVSGIWFNRYMGPLGLFLLFLTGAGPLLAWRKTAKKTLVKNFFVPTIAFLIVLSSYIGFHLFRYKSINMEELHILAGLTFALSAFVITGVVEEFIRTALTRTRITKESFLVGLFLMFFQNKRRYLGYTVHIGLALLFIGFAGKAFSKETKLSLKQGESEYFQGYLIEAGSFTQSIYPPEAMRDRKIIPLYTGQVVRVNVYKNNKLIKSDVSEIRNYFIYNLSTGKYDGEQPTSEPAIMSTLLEDVYVQLGGIDESGNLILQVWINPLVGMVWFGFLFYNIFLIVLLLPIGEKRNISLFGKEYSTAPVYTGNEA